MRGRLLSRFIRWPGGAVSGRAAASGVMPHISDAGARVQAAVFRAGQNVGVHPCCGASALRFDTAATRRLRHRNECCRRPHSVDAARPDQAATLALLEGRRELVLAPLREDDGGGGVDGYISPDTGEEEGDAEGEVEDEEAEEDAAAAAAARSRRRIGSQDTRAGYGGAGGQRRKAASAVATIYAPGLVQRARGGGGRGGGGSGSGAGGGGPGGEGKDGIKPTRQWSTELQRACPLSDTMRILSRNTRLE